MDKKSSFRFTRCRIVLASMFAMACGDLLAQGTITSGGASYVLTASHFDITPETNFTGVGTGDQIFESGWWFRVEGDTAETVFPAPTTQNYAGDTATIQWGNLGGRNLAVTKTHTITSGGAGQGETVTTLDVTNNGAAAITLHLFHFVDFDVNGSAGTDTGSLVTANNYIRINDATAGQCEYRAPAAVAYLVSAFSATTDVAAQLSNATVTNFANTGLPFGPGDITAGLQFTFQLAAGATQTVRVHQACNTAATPVSLQHFEVD